MTTTWQTTTDVAEFLAAAGGFLRSRPAEHTIHLTIVEALRAGAADGYPLGHNVPGQPGPWFGWWCDDGGRVASALVRTPPRAVQVTDVPDAAIGPLVDVLAGRGGSVTEIELGASRVDRFVARWRRRTGGACRELRRSRLYRLGTLEPPRPAPRGAARLAGPDDRDTLLTWIVEFARDVGHDVTDAAPLVDDRLGDDGFTLWEVDGSPVSAAGRTRQVAGMVRIAPVYTPPPLRRLGYAGAVTAELSRASRAAGADHVVLLTDLANPTSNALYQRLGYRAVLDRVALSLTG